MPRPSDVDRYIDLDPKKISWDRADKTRIAKGERYAFRVDRIFTSTYRPFTRQYVYFDRKLNNTVYQLAHLFPTPLHRNFGFYITGTGADEPFSLLMVDGVPDRHTVGTKSVDPHFARYTYRELAVEGGFDFGDGDGGYERIDNITDSALADYRKA